MTTFDIYLTLLFLVKIIKAFAKIQNIFKKIYYCSAYQKSNTFSRLRATPRVPEMEIPICDILQGGIVL